MYSPGLIGPCIPYKIMSLIRKSGNSAIAAVAPEALPLAYAIEEGFDLVSGAEKISGAIDRARSAYRKVRSGVDSINDSISGGASRPSVGVTQALVKAAISDGDRGYSKVPVSMNKRVTNKPAVMRSIPGGMRISHRELVDTLEGAVNWAEVHFMELNPGLSYCFPWLSTIAKSFQQYRPVGPLKLEFIPSVATTQSGALYMAPNYVADGEVPSNESEAANLDGTISGSVWAPLSMTLSQKALLGLGPRKFVRTEMESGDLKTFDMGFVQCSMVGCSDTAVKGRLFVSYDFEFYCPIVSPGTLADPDGFSAFTSVDGAILNFAHNVAAVVPVPIVLANGLRITNPVSGTFGVPRGRYLLTFFGSFTLGTLSGLWAQCSCSVGTSGSNLVDGRLTSWSNCLVSTAGGGMVIKFSDQFILECSDSTQNFVVRLTPFAQGLSGQGTLLSDPLGSKAKVIFQLL